MKRLLLSAALALLCVASIAQSLQTIRTYYDYGRTKVNEVYTVISGTPTKQGAYKQYNQDGTLMEVANYSNNKLNGAYTLYYPDGSINISAIHKNGVLHGNYAQYSNPSMGHKLVSKRIYDNDNITYDEAYYDSGTKRKVEHLNGLWEEWNENGIKVLSATLENGKIQGARKKWYDDGKMKSIVFFDNDVAHGKYISFYPNGVKEVDGVYDHGAMTGIYTEWHDNNSIKRKNILSAPNVLQNVETYARNGIKHTDITHIKDDIYATTIYDTISGKKQITYEQKAKDVGKEEGYRITQYNPDETINTVTHKNVKGQVREERYYPSGQIKLVLDYDDTTLSYSESGVLQWKIWRDNDLTINGKKCYPYEDYDASGNITKKGYIDSENSSDVQYVSYENGVKTSELKSTGEIYEYYPTGKVKEHYRPTSNTITKFDEQGGVSLILDTKQRGSISYYPNKIIKEKGYINENYEPTGVWYYYNDKGKLLSVKENGVERKPNSTDKNSHEAFLSDLHKTNLKINQ